MMRSATAGLGDDDGHDDGAGGDNNGEKLHVTRIKSE